MAALQTAGVRPRRHSPRARPTRRQISPGSGSQLVSLYVGIAAVGIAALGCAASSSLLSGATGATGATGGAAWWRWAAALASSAWAGAALVYALASWRTGRLPLAGVAARTVVGAASVHLALILIGAWRLPEESRFLDLTVASLLVLELSVLAVVGWQHNRALRTSSRPRAGRTPSALAVVATMFAASIVVASVTSVGLAASTAGQLAVPHSGHGATSPGSLPGNLEQLRHSGHHH
ncbi:hypothetical protein [Arthrobacter dokdonensis]|uniref:hypothetical protein n=1 Tax=Arthrobacter dokdonellae TaxID=2211210 RepID=UPI000DE58291|nr:hypothetical protein [Arthrobacter dokdonellae]